MDSFGSTDPKKMPGHLFYDALDIDYATAIRANVAVQYCSVCPRHWYIDARFRCSECRAEFVWSAQEQKVWFETYRFWVDSQPMLCRACSAKRRNALHLRQEYDSLVASARSGGTPAQKMRIIEIVDDLESYLKRVPVRLSETRELFRKQIAKVTHEGGTEGT